MFIKNYIHIEFKGLTLFQSIQQNVKPQKVGILRDDAKK